MKRERESPVDPKTLLKVIAGLPLEAWNKIRVRRIGDAHIVEVDGTLVVRAKDGSERPLSDRRALRLLELLAQSTRDREAARLARMKAGDWNAGKGPPWDPS